MTVIKVIQVLPKIEKEDSLLLIFILSFISCAKIQVTAPSSRYLSPEAQGKRWAGVVRAEQQAGTEGTLNFDGNRTDNPMEMRNTSTPLGFGFEMGIDHNIDFVLKSNSNSASVYTLKWQLMGANRQDARVGNKSLAVTIGHGKSGTTETQSDTSVFNDSDDNLEADITQHLLEASIIYGVRTDDTTVIYTSIQVSKYDLSFKLFDVDTPELDQETFAISSWNYGLSLGAIKYLKRANISVEASVQRTDFTYNAPITYGFITGALGVNW